MMQILHLFVIVLMVYITDEGLHHSQEEANLNTWLEFGLHAILPRSDALPLASLLVGFGDIYFLSTPSDAVSAWLNPSTWNRSLFLSLALSHSSKTIDWWKSQINRTVQCQFKLSTYIQHDSCCSILVIICIASIERGSAIQKDTCDSFTFFRRFTRFVWTKGNLSVMHNFNWPSKRLPRKFRGSSISQAELTMGSCE